MNYLHLASDVKIDGILVSEIYISTLGDIIIHATGNPALSIIAVSKLKYDDLDSISLQYSYAEQGEPMTIMDRMESENILPPSAFRSLKTVVDCNLRTKKIFAISKGISNE